MQKGTAFLPRGGGHTSELGPPGRQPIQKPHDWSRGGHPCPLLGRGSYRKGASRAGCATGCARHCQHLAQTLGHKPDSEAGLASRHLWWAAPSQAASLPAETGPGPGPPLECVGISRLPFSQVGLVPQDKVSSPCPDPRGDWILSHVHADTGLTSQLHV